ncbi:MAG: pyridoxamine 5'-phosphate oxidase family protein [Firmicutes bacterium]|nr:pyridoxamine 5'-phosphate oxidase family protein [Bacillota bacterium]MBR3787966.1 pyridoxamine 5'-phosphate oxidase family protein [Bacillota bacterium]
MFREMRRKDKMKTYEEAVQILGECTNGVLSVIGDDGYPYGVPVSYIYHDGKIYFHCAGEGHKLDAIKADSRVSFTVVGADEIAPEKFTTMYKSVIAFGRASIIDTDEEKMAALNLIREKYSGNFPKEGAAYIEKFWDKTTVVVIEIEHMTGKGLA